MVLIPAGAFQMGSSEMFDFEAPVHQVSIRKPFYIGRREVTYEEWDACIAEAGCKQKPDDRRPWTRPAPGDRSGLGRRQGLRRMAFRKRPGAPIGFPLKASGVRREGRQYDDLSVGPDCR